MLPFHKVVAELRKEAGYASPRAFYNARGGQGFFKCTYRQYFNIEKGITAPKPRIVQRIALGLDLVTSRERAWRFATAYLRLVSGDARTFDLIVDTLAHPPNGLRERPSALVRTINDTIIRNRRVLTLQESKFIRSSPAAYWTWQVLSSDRSQWSAKELASCIGSPETAVRKALRRLSGLKLVAMNKGGKYYCPHASDSYFEHPLQEAREFNYQALIENYESMLAKKGKILAENFVTVRASKAAVQQYLPHILEACRGAEVCRTDRKGADTALFLITMRLAKIISY